MKYDYLIVGSGLFGSIFAYEAKKKGKKVLVIDKRPHIGGNIYTEKIEGINVEKINKKFYIDFREKYAQIIKKYIDYKYLKETNTGFTLTTEGILISNLILSEFLE